MKLKENFNNDKAHYALLMKYKNSTKIVQRLSSDDYLSMDDFINILEFLHGDINEALEILNDTGIENYIIQRDVALYYNLQSLMLSVSMLKNILGNFTVIMSKSSMKHN